MSRRSPLLTVWLRPSETVARIAHENPGYRLFVLPIVAGFAVWLTAALDSRDSDPFDYGLLPSALLSFGPIGELVQVFAGAYLLRLTGSWLGGTAGSTSIQTAIAWANAPIVVIACIGFLIPILFGFADLSTRTLLEHHPTVYFIAGWALFALQFVLVAWSYFIFLKGLASVQGFSVARAALNTLLATAIPVIILAVTTVALGSVDDLSWLLFSGMEYALPEHQ